MNEINIILILYFQKELMAHVYNCYYNDILEFVEQLMVAGGNFKQQYKKGLQSDYPIAWNTPKRIKLLLIAYNHSLLKSSFMGHIVAVRM